MLLFSKGRNVETISPPGEGVRDIKRRVIPMARILYSFGTIFTHLN